MPTAIGCVARSDGSGFNRTQNTPRFQNGVAFPLATHRRALDGVVGIRGFCSASTTGTNMR
jgi:hypothetical protein